MGRLLSLGANVNLRAQMDVSAVHLTCKANRASTLGLLIAAGASLNFRDTYGHTPLTQAALFGAFECMERLLACGAEAIAIDIPNVPRWDGDTAPHLMLNDKRHPGSLRLVPLLRQAGANPTIRNEKGKKALHLS